MPSIFPTEWLEERPTSFFVSVYRVGKVWRVLIAETGYTMSERLNSRRIIEVDIPEDRAAQMSTNRELLAEMASIMLDFADGIAGNVTALSSL